METVIRVAILYVLILAGLRVMGKRDFSQLSPIEFVALLLIPELASQALLREDFSMTNAIVALATLFTLVFLNSLLSFHLPAYDKVVSGSPTVLVAHGKLQEKMMNRERIPAGEIMAEVHKSGLEQVEQVKWAILESDGHISIVPESPPHARAASDPRTE